MHKIELGDRVRDEITRFEGIVTGRVEYVSGCTQYLLAPPAKPDGDFAEPKWFDDDRLVVTKVGSYIAKRQPDPVAAQSGPGFCEPAPVR